MITFNNVYKRRGATEILRDVSFSVQPGRVTGFLGMNGAGKSSSLRILLGLDAPSSGQALFTGREYRSLTKPLNQIGASMGGAGTHPARTAKNHLRWLAHSNGIDSSRVTAVLEEVGLGHAANKRVGTFSLGMAQRLGLATALLGQPETLVLDEPINGLDPDGIRWFRQLIRAHADAGGTVLLSSHVISELALVADDVVIIHQGTIKAAAPLAQLQSEHGDLETAFFGVTGGVA